jgi:peptide/nickel transport system substrate-binding protein
MIARRSFLGAGAGALLLTTWPWPAPARGRASYGGSLALHAPWPIASIDPHRIDDPAAALFGDALFDTLYGPGQGDAFLPRLAESDPEPDGRSLRVKLRTGVAFASGAHLDARSVTRALARARSADAGAWLADVPAPHAVGDTLVFAMTDARRLVRALASPLVAIVPPRFSPDRPDGTGPFRAAPQPLVLALRRNTLAACGPSLLDAIDVQRAPDLATSLRAFESGADDIGWLGSFLHEPRQGARPFDAGAVAWVILRTGRDAGALDAPGTAQALADGVPHAALASLVVGPAWTQGSAQWTGTPCELLVRDDAPWLTEVARALAVALSVPSHEVVARPLPRADLVQRRTTRSFVLMLDIARPAGPGDLGALIGLATANDPAAAFELARHPPRGEIVPRSATRTMRIGVVGEVRVQGGQAPGVVLPPSAWGRGVDWGGAWRKP